ncbi:MAG: 50S ribosomal protein L4 [Deltaproteobacteria bacterium]|nr:50S ribosomal protein L4 [Candidatus Anaeroferrophillus wilburensis]MBN2889521.1 50S ribosomal protein L4 [Deltaproteobacteria bacterium]
MAVVDLYNMKKEKVGEVELSEAIFNAEVKEHLIQEMVIWQLAKRRSGTAAVKSRSQVRGGGAKPWRQKGSGRARSGTSRSPIWRSGGVVFGPQPRSYDYKLPKKVKRQALISVLTQKHLQGKLLVLDAFAIDEIKTKTVAEMLSTFGVSSAMLVCDDNRNLALSARNLPRVMTVGHRGVNVYDLMKHDHLLISADALASIQGALVQ